MLTTKGGIAPALPSALGSLRAAHYVGCVGELRKHTAQYRLRRTSYQCRYEGCAPSYPSAIIKSMVDTGCRSLAARWYSGECQQSSAA